MKNISISLNIILLIAVAILYYFHFKDKKETIVSSDNKPLSAIHVNNADIVYVNSDSLLDQYEFYKSENGKFRVLVAEDKDDRPWPKEMKMGTGAVGFALLKNVAIWYELWRNINGFPPDFYKENKNGGDEK